jgi:hypothetical protein
MTVFLNLFFLLLGSLLILRPKTAMADVPIGWIQHTGLILLLYGFANTVAFLIGFNAQVDAGPLWAGFRMGCWILLVVIGFTLAYPLIERHVLNAAGEDLSAHGRNVFQGFTAMRWPLGLAGLLVTGILAAFRLGWL